MTNDRRRRVLEVFDEVVEAEPDRRDALLEELCAGDAELVAAVRLLLEHDEASDSFLQPPVASALAGLISREMASDLVGTLVGPYRVTRLIESGGMGTVYHAVRADGDAAHEVAIKVIREGMLGPDMVRRFERERKLLGSLRHPGVASFIDAGVTSDGLPYLVMEYIDGEPIDAYCDRNLLRIPQRLRLLAQVCDAVAYAHRNLLVHRDIKPSNILVTRGGAPKLLDFGIAKLIQDGGTVGTWTRTATERRIITPQYASPEVMRGEPVSTAMDVYSLGLVLYELLTGRRPYDMTGESAVSAERLVCELEPALPSVAVGRNEVRVSASGTRTQVDPKERARLRGSTPQELKRLLRGDLDTVVMTALHKDATRRYQSVEQFAADLERHLTGYPILARKDSFGYRAAKFYKRHRLGVVMGAVALLSLFVGVAGVVYGYVRARHETRVAQLEALKASEINDFLHEMLSAADPEEGRTDVTVREVLDASSDRVDTELSALPEVRAALHQTIGETYVNLGLHAQAEPHLRQSLRLRELEGEEDSPASCQTLLALGRTLRLAGHHEEAGRVLEDALRRSEALGDAGQSLDVRCLIALGRVKDDQGAFAEAETLFRRALDAGRQAYGTRHRDVAEAMERLGMNLSSRGRSEEAAKLCREALEINRSLFGDRHVRVSNSLRRLAVVLHEQGRLDEAEPLYRESLAMHRALFGDDHPEVARVLNNLGWLLFTTGRRDEGRTMLEEALAIRRRIFGNEHAAVATTLNNLAATYSAAEAEPLLRESLALSKRIYGPRHFSVGRTSQNLATSLKEQGKLAEAEPLYRQAVDIMKETLGPTHPSVVYALMGLAEVLVKRGESDEAGTLLSDCIAIPTGGRPAIELLRASALGLLGDIETERGSYAEAETHLLEALRVAESFGGSADDLAAHRRRLVDLYEAWGKPDRAAAYQTQFASPPGGDSGSHD